MRVEKDFEELLKLFNKHQVKYCVVGAFAMAFYAQPRYTKDLDLLVEPTPENGQRIVSALNEFGFGSLNLSAADFSVKDKFIQLGYEPIRVDLITSIKGLDFSIVWEHRREGQYGGQRAYFIGLEEFVKSKEIANRKQDIADLERISNLKKNKSK